MIIRKRSNDRPCQTEEIRISRTPPVAQRIAILRNLESFKVKQSRK